MTSSYFAQSSYAQAIAIDSSDRIYVAGEGRDSWVVRKSTDQGTTWSTADESFEDLKFYSAGSAVIDPSGGSIFVGGTRGTDSSGSKRWLIRKSSDQGTTWTEVSTTTPSLLLAAGPSGELYSAGYHRYDETDTRRWLLHASTDAGVSWTEIDAFDAGGGLSYLHRLAVGPTGILYAAGYVSSDDNGLRWYVRKSADAGASWTTVDDFTPGGKYGSLDQLAVGPNGELLVTGHVYTDYSHSYWIMRKSLDHGATWSHVSGPDESAYDLSYLQTLLISPTSDIFVTGVLGMKSYYSSSDSWYLRRSADLGASWTTLAGTPYAGDFHAYGSAVDSAGNIYLAGGGGGKWTVKKLDVVDGKLKTVDSFQGDLHWESEYPNHSHYCH